MSDIKMKGHVLVVEDDFSHRLIVEELLSDMGLTVTAVDNGFAALDKLETGHRLFDLVVLDWEMPEIDGLETVRKIRARQLEQGWPHIPVLAFTGNKREGDEEKCLAAGMDDYLPKECWLPKWQPLLHEKLEKWLTFKDEDSQTKTAT